MKVEAIAQGFYGGRRYREGEQFEVPPGAKGKWFVPVAVVERPKGEPAKPEAFGKAGGKKPEKDAAPLA